MSSNFLYWDIYTGNLCLESQAGTNLVGSLIELLGIERGAEAKGDTGAEEHIVSDSGDTTVIDLGLGVVR